MTQNTAQRIPTTANTAPQDNFAARRDMIDRIATVRAKTIRIELFARMIYLPDPKYAQDQDHLAEVFSFLQIQVQEIEEVCQLITGTYQGGDVAPAIREWVFAMAQTMPQETDEIIKMASISHDVETACGQSTSDMARALDIHMQRGRGGFHDVVTRFITGLWTDLDATREQEAQDATQSTKAVSAILSRLEYIGKHVRLVSLNASVEAARAGDAGRGLAVIATEFKTLAEEIQSLATRARGEIDTK